MNRKCQRAILCPLQYPISKCRGRGRAGVGGARVLTGTWVSSSPGPGAGRSTLRGPGRAQCMPCSGQPSSLAYAPLQLLISWSCSRHLFRPGTPDLQPMKPWVVFGTGGDGSTCNGNAGALSP